MLGEGTVERADGRVVAWAAFGDPDGRPLLAFHGTPGCRLNGSIDPGLYERINVHLVKFDRPGYGRSSVQRDRTILSVADDATSRLPNTGAVFAIPSLDACSPIHHSDIVSLHQPPPCPAR